MRRPLAAHFFDRIQLADWIALKPTSAKANHMLTSVSLRRLHGVLVMIW